jgi:DNA (cytosine-5)-methyltransferase 1
MTPKVGALFAGYGGLELAVSDVFPDAHPAWVAEFEAAPSRILAQRFPDVPNLGDVTKVQWGPACPTSPDHKVQVFRFGYAADTSAETAYHCVDCGWELPVDQRPDGVPYPVEIITGGSPCQDLSHAGKRAGMRAGTRSGLWASMCDAIEIIRPQLVIWENVRGALSACASSETDRDLGPCPRCLDSDSVAGHAPNLRALGRVLGDLAELGFDAAWTTVRASDAGAPHQRERVFVLAWPADAPGQGLEAWGEGRGGGGAAGAGLGGHPPVLNLLPSPRTSDTNGAGVHGDGGLDLRTAVALLPTPTTEPTTGNGHARNLGAEARAILPTPRATRGGSATETVALLPTPAVNDMGASYDIERWDAWTARMKATHGNGNGHGNSLHIEALRMLPTPTSTDHKASGATYDATETHHAGTTLTDATVRQADRFGQYAPAIARWEAVLGRPAPAPTEPTGKGGAHRLSPRFVEWLMGLPDGWVTDTDTTRNEQLKALGNGVVPQQAAAAIRHLLTVRAMALTQEMAA